MYTPAVVVVVGGADDDGGCIHSVFFSLWKKWRNRGRNPCTNVPPRKRGLDASADAAEAWSRWRFLSTVGRATPRSPPSRVLDVFPPRVKSRQSEPTKTTASNGPGAVVPSVLVGRAAPPISRAEVCPSQRRSCPNTTLRSIGLYPPPGDVANPARLKTPTPDSTLLAPIRNHRTEVRAPDPLLYYNTCVLSCFLARGHNTLHNLTRVYCCCPTGAVLRRGEAEEERALGEVRGYHPGVAQGRRLR